MSEWTRAQVLAVLSTAKDLIVSEDFRADTSLACEVVDGVKARLTTPGPFTREHIMTLANAEANEILDGERFEIEYSVTIRDTSLVDLTVNAIGSLLDDPDMTLDEVMRECWQPEDPYEDAAEMVREWLDQ